MRKHKKCICGRGFYLQEGQSRKYCKECVALAKKHKKPVIVLKGGSKDG